MFKKLILASATAAVALTAAVDFYAGTFDLTSEAVAQTMRLKKTPAEPTPPSRGPAKPSNTLASPFIDLAGEYLNPQIQEGQAGSHYCSSEPGGGRSKHVQIVVRNKGTTFAGPVHVSFTFATGQFLTHTIPMIQSGAAKGSAVAIPDGAWKNGKAQFQISIDPTDTIGETNESNNTFHSFCTDPNA